MHYAGLKKGLLITVGFWNGVAGKNVPYKCVQNALWLTGFCLLSQKNETPIKRLPILELFNT